jgi:hypothetical protein
MVANAAYSFKPLSRLEGRAAAQLQIRLDSFVFFRETTGAIEARGLEADSAAHYLGSEADLSITFRPFSDLGLALAAGAFVPNTTGAGAAFDPAQRGIEYQLRLDTSFSF